MKNDKEAYANLEKQISEFNKIAAHSVDPCIIAKSIALSNQEVQDTIMKKLSEGSIFKGLHCLERVTSWELIYIYFDFDCKPGVHCLVKPAFVAIVNIISGKVIDIIDPYIQSNINKLKAILNQETNSYPKTEPLGERTYCVLSNHSGRDFHIRVSCDVHTGNWGPKQINNGEAPEIKSKKIPYDDYAKYCFEVWKNDAGQLGKPVGSFEHSVSYDVLGVRDHLEFTIINVDGKDHLQVFSAKKVARIALMIWTMS